MAEAEDFDFDFFGKNKPPVKMVNKFVPPIKVRTEEDSDDRTEPSVSGTEPTYPSQLGKIPLISVKEKRTRKKKEKLENTIKPTKVTTNHRQSKVKILSTPIVYTRLTFVTFFIQKRC